MFTSWCPIGYQGDTKGADGTDNAISNNKGATDKQVKEHLNGLFSLVQGLGGTAVVRTYIDQLAQVLSALVGWSSIEKCWSNGECKKVHSSDLNGNPHGGSGCKYLEDKDSENKCGTCGCMKYVVINGTDWVQLGRGCTRCKDSGSEDDKKKQECKCGTGGGGCSAGEECKCALAGKCCKCCCTDCRGRCKEECSCDKEKSSNGTYNEEYRIHSYTSAYPYKPILIKDSYVESKRVDVKPYWKDLTDLPDYYPGSASSRRHHCARILLGSVCLIWSGITYMHWTGKWHITSPYWNNHILDGSSLDDGSLSQWLQALGFPKDMLNDKGPKNRLDQVIWDGFMGKLFLGFTHPKGSNAVDGNTAKQPYDMNYAGFVHTAHRDSFNNEARVFKNGDDSSTSDIDQNKIGAIFKLYIISCAYFTGLQKRTTESTPRTPKTIREILYWLSALPYSSAYKDMLGYAKERLAEVLKKPGDNASTTEQSELNFHQTGRWHPITVHQYNLFAHFQAVTQYCPLVLIGIQGGLHSTDSTTPAIHALYANTECNFTYPTVSIQAYNQVVHYIRALFYQLYLLRKQCAVKVAMGGKWRECRYGKDVVSKGVISWMCLGCNPMEHDRKSRVQKVKGVLDGMKTGSDAVVKSLVDVLKDIGDVVVQLGNAQEVLEKDIKNESVAVDALKKVSGGNGKNGNLHTVLEAVLEEVKEKVTALEGVVEKVNGLEGEKKKALEKAKTKLTEATTALNTAKEMVKQGDKKDKLNAAHHWIRQVVESLLILKDWWNNIKTNGCQKHLQDDIANAIDNMEDIVGSTRCAPCHDHSTKCGQKPESRHCEKCHQQYMDGFPSPLQAFLENRLPGFSCEVVRNTDTDNDTPEYPPAASHLGHCGGSGQCCPLPMGFRGNFHSGSTSDMTGQRLYGILYFFSNEHMMQSCAYRLVRVTSALSATTPQVLGDVFGFFRGGVGNPVKGENQKGQKNQQCGHIGSSSEKEHEDKYFCGWCASGLRDVVKEIEWIQKVVGGDDYRTSVGQALINIKDDKDSAATANTSLSTLTDSNHYVSPLTGELYTAVSATFGGTYLSWVLYLSDALHSGLESLSEAFRNIECRGCKGCDPNKCRKGSHGETGNAQYMVSATVTHSTWRGTSRRGKRMEGDYSIEKKENGKKQCHQFLDSLKKVIESTEKATSQKDHPLSNLLTQVGQLQYDIRLPWIFVLTADWLVAVLYLAFGALWPLDWTYMRSHWLRGGEHQWQCMWYKVMTGRRGVDLMEYFGRM
ncbi:variant erythrocyte surface antigen-1 alpha subunit [Babesia bovis T2Bo]|uniref:Variant erythrocyte surface antigen-1, alpha subunit n=1 Tax=Babesia bovis TaxID=5865 RepID=A7AW00_BABBO|nr:variant erythrocyte surface antigen-1 alpha subunit [Babesia bovis T2Bo]EDO05228.1 variant erythrocyte surface antigen-1 alpha subunit [Babesia bovis T2Bo]|eukprot:XP_001608796.1 variant erythrocyte surface antigen-1, alpha subunit [Babesia bovis T2Bo]